jgi:hypothetical protein
MEPPNSQSPMNYGRKEEGDRQNMAPNSKIVKSERKHGDPFPFWSASSDTVN